MLMRIKKKKKRKKEKKRSLVYPDAYTNEE